MNEQKKISYFLPNTFTALNMGCGFFAIMHAIKGNYYGACLFILLGAIFDLFDGRVARWTGTQSAFGEQFDSLSDLITFGLAPGLIFYFRFLTDLKRFGMVVAFIFVLCGALRLARFNANIKNISSNYFQGLPIPGAAMAVVSYIWLSLEFPIILSFDVIALIYLLIYAFLMISNIPFESFKDTSSFKENKLVGLLLIVLLISSIAMYEEVMLLFWITVYVVYCLISFIKNKKGSLLLVGEKEIEDLDE